MRLLIGFLTYLVILTACAVPIQPTTAPTEPAASEPQAVTIDGTFETSLIVTAWRDGPKGSTIFPLNPASGTALPGYKPISLGYSFNRAFSPDMQTLAVVSFSDAGAHNGSLWLIDLPAWKARRFEMTISGWVNTMAFSQDGRRLAVAHGETDYSITVIDVEQGNIIAQAPMDFFVSRLRFTMNNEALMVYRPGNNPTNSLSSDPPEVLLLDTTDLKPRWSAKLAGVRDGVFAKDETLTPDELYEPGNAFYFTPALVFAPDCNVLYIVHADSEQLTTVDFEAQKVETVNIQPRLSWFEQLLSLDASVAHAKTADGADKQAAISPDGRLLYVTGIRRASFLDQKGNVQLEETPLGLEIIQTSNGSRVEHLETDATELSLSPDGRFLYLRHWGDAITMPWTEVFDTSSRQIITRKEALYATPALLMNGQFLLASTYISPEDKYAEQHHMSILQPSDLSVLSEWKGPDFVYWPTP